MKEIEIERLEVSLDTHLFLERRSICHCVHNGVRNAGVQLSDSPLGIQAQRIVTTVDRHYEPLHCFHVPGPSQVQLGCWLRQATSARTIRSIDTFPSIFYFANCNFYFLKIRIFYGYFVFYFYLVSHLSRDSQ